MKKEKKKDHKGKKKKDKDRDETEETIENEEMAFVQSSQKVPECFFCGVHTT